jgi:hypothetical protein
VNLDDSLPFSPAAERNRGPILDVLRRLLPSGARVLEIASGTGQHAAHFAAAEPGWTWQPTEGDAGALPAIARRCSGLANVRPPLLLDVLAPWPAAVGPCDVVYAANLLHIAPWRVCHALLQGSAACLATDGRVVLYGPYVVDGEPLAPSNAAFDADLRRRDPDWGLRHLADVVEAGREAGLEFFDRQAMPANNLVLALRKAR